MSYGTTAFGTGTFGGGVPLQDALLGAARRLFDSGEYAAAVVAAQTASEVLMAGVLNEMGSGRIEQTLWDQVSEFVSSYNLWKKNTRLRGLYEALSGDADLGHQPFWKDGSLTRHVQRRHAIVHRGALATRKEAEDSIAVVEALIAHVQGVRSLFRARNRAADLEPTE
jgi:hypothetical protein